MRNKHRKTASSHAARLPTAHSALQRTHGTGWSGPCPAKEPLGVGKFAVFLAPGTSPRSSSQPATMATTNASNAKKGMSNSLEQREKKHGEEGVLVETATVASPKKDVAYLGFQITSLRWLPRHGMGDASATSSQDSRDI